MSKSGHIFFSDINLPNQYYGVLVRSPLKSGRLKEIVPPEMPDGYFLFTAADIPGKNAAEINGGKAPIFAEGEVSYIGEPAGIVAGPDYEVATSLAQKTQLVIEEREAEELATMEEAFLATAAQKGDTAAFFSDKAEKAGESPVPEKAGEGEEAKKEENGGEDEVPAGEKRADKEEEASDAREPLVITESFAEILPMEYSRNEHSGALANCSEESVEVYAASLWPFHAKKTVADALAFPLEKITVIPTSPGEAHDGKIWTPSLAAAQAAVAAFRCKRAVKLIFSRSEELSYLPKMPPAKIKIKSAAAPDGKIKAMEADIEINCGSAAPFASEISARITAAMQEFYSAENAKASLRLARTNLPPMMPENDFGESHAFLALETHLDLLSRKLAILPNEARRANMADEKYFPLMETVCEKSGFSRKYTAYENLNKKRSGIKDGPVRGIGLSLACQRSGFLSAWHEGIRYSVEITMEKTAEVHIKAGSYSSSIKEIICAITANSLGIGKDQISFANAGADATAFSGPDILSTSTAIVLPLVSRCCSAIQRQRFRQPLPITVKKTYKPSKPAYSEKGLDLRRLQRNPFVPVTPAACVVELELNPLDWAARVRGVWIACSAGKLLDKNAAENTLKKNAKEALAKLSCEASKIKEGKFCKAKACGVPQPAPMAAPQVYFLESKEFPRGLGNIAYNLLPAAYCSALMQITGKSEIKVPVAARDIWSFFSGAASVEA